MTDTPQPARAVAGNAAVLTAGFGVEMLLQFVFLLVVGRGLGPEDFGFYGYVLSLVTIAITVAHFGLPAIAVREIAQRPAAEGALFAATMRIRGSLAALIFLAGAALAVLTLADGDRRAATVILLAYLLFVPFDLGLMFDARRLSRWDVPGKIAGRVFSVSYVAVVWGMTGRLTIGHVAVAATGLMLINVAVAWFAARYLRIPLRPLAATRETCSLLRQSWPIAWSNLMMVVYSQSQTVFVKWLSTEAQTGFYALALRLLMPLIAIKATLYRVLLPVMSEVGSDAEALSRRLEKILPALALLFIPAAALAIPAVDVLLVPLFGAEFAGAIRPLQIGLSLLLFTGFASAFGSALLAAGDARTPTVGLTIGTALSITLGLLLVERWGAAGAAWAAWTGELVAVLYTVPPFRRRFQPRIAPRILRIGAAGLSAPAVFFLLTGFFNVTAAAALAAGAAALTAMLMVVRELTRERIETVRSLIRDSFTRRGG